MAEIIKLNKSNCKNCYKCIRNCPVKSIRFSGNQASIINDDCILCGQCYVVCPQNAKEVVDDTEMVKVLLAGANPVVVSFAPSFVANYKGVGIKQMEEALQKLGFFSAEETAIGATYVKNEYAKIMKEKKHDILITSACHSVNLLLEKYYPNLLKYLAPVVTPMHAHALDIKNRNPNAKVVFIGPCISKKDEAQKSNGVVDAVLTYEELSRWFEKESIDLTEQIDHESHSKARFFPTNGGIIKSLNTYESDIQYLSVDGVENCINALRDIEKGGVHNCFIEMSACVGSCIGGPVMEKFKKAPIRDYFEVINYAGETDFSVIGLKENQLDKYFIPVVKEETMPSEEAIRKILIQMGKTKKDDELNCGSCGYNSCREKAIAIHQGKADLSMCLPFLKEKAESFYNNILNNTPTGIIILNEELEVQQINKAAKKIINIRSDKDILGDQVIRILDPKPFINARDNSKNIYGKRTYLAEYEKYVELTVIHDLNYRIIMCIMRDVTEEIREREYKERTSKKTIEVADRVVEKQMRIVQEIASLLGETAAETKIVLTKLKESIRNE
ncbi:MAG: 4Fe-4S binding protein [Tenericutes bacterium]|nr:4Fe-4S binding protein [Mycoplasmatota bacterium]